jgi:hypothetical protein
VQLAFHRARNQYASLGDAGRLRRALRQGVAVSSMRHEAALCHANVNEKREEPAYLSALGSTLTCQNMP